MSSSHSPLSISCLALTVFVQYMPRKNKVTLRLKIGGTEIVEEGVLLSEATFISE